MAAEAREPARGTSQLVEVLDRVLDRGIVIDAEVRLHIAGLSVAGLEARIVVAAIETYLEYADAIASTPPASWRADVPDLAVPPLFDGNETHFGNRLRPFLEDDGLGLP